MIPERFPPQVPAVKAAEIRAQATIRAAEIRARATLEAAALGLATSIAAAVGFGLAFRGWRLW